MNTKKLVRQLEEWVEAKRRSGLSDAHVQMARELGLKPKRLTIAGRPGAPPAQRVEELYLRRFKRTIPDPVVPVRQLLHEARRQERDEARERRQQKRQAEREHAEAARISLLTLQRLCSGRGLRYAMGAYDDLTEQNPGEVVDNS